MSEGPSSMFPAMRTKTTTCLLLTAAALAGCRPGPASVVVRGATIIDGTGAPPIPSGVLVVDRGRVTCVGTAEDCPDPGSARVVDGDGFWIIPGLIDTHVHPKYDGVPRGTDQRERLRFLLGVTTTRDASTRGNFAANVAAAVRSREAGRPTPRLLVSGLVEEEDAADPASAGAKIRGLAAGGASSIKVKAGFPHEIRVAIVQAAADEGLETWGHTWSEQPTRSQVEESVADGYAGLAHLLEIPPAVLDTAVLDAPPAPWREPGWTLWRRTLWLEADPADLAALARRLAATGTWLEPILVSEEYWAQPFGIPVGLYRLAELPLVVDAIRTDEDPAGRPAEERDRLARSVEVARVFVREFHDAGGVVVTGTDDLLAPGLSLHEEIKELVKAGFTPAEALAAATRVAAEVIGVSDSLGTLEPGKLADFVMLQGDPLADVENLELVYRVAKAGLTYDPASLLETLKNDLADRTSPPGRRLLAALAALLVTIVATAIAIRRHARRQPPRPPPLRAI